MSYNKAPSYHRPINPIKSPEDHLRSPSTLKLVVGLGPLVPDLVLALGGHDLLSPHGRVERLDDIVHHIHLDKVGLDGRLGLDSGDDG